MHNAVGTSPSHFVRECDVSTRQHSGLALDFGGALNSPEQLERTGNVGPACSDAMISQYQDILVAQACDHAALFVGEERDALEFVIADAAEKLCAVEIIVSEAALFQHDGGHGGSVGMD